MEDAPYILTENLKGALEIAIDSLQKKERELGYTRPSARLAGWMANLEFLRKHDYLDVHSSS